MTSPLRPLHRIALWLERRFDSVRRLVRPRPRTRAIEAYDGYADETHMVARGRVLSAVRRNRASAHQSRLVNFRQMLSLFFTSEVANVTVHAEGTTAITDEEGYFALRLPRDNRTPGWHDIHVRIPDTTQAAPCPVLIPRADARFIIISDIDDTVLLTGAHSLVRNLWTSLTGNATTRRVFPDAVQLLDSLSEGGRNPVFYVSSSPWNFFHFLSRIFDRAGIVRGPMFLRDLGLSETKFITSGHGTHKSASIETILATAPHVPAVLVGDTGQKDASIYLAVARQHPGRIRAVMLRKAGPVRGALDDDLDGLRKAGVPFVLTQDDLVLPDTFWDKAMKSAAS